jgi:hypothetical protein
MSFILKATSIISIKIPIGSIKKTFQLKSSLFHVAFFSPNKQTHTREKRYCTQKKTMLGKRKQKDRV